MDFVKQLRVGSQYPVLRGFVRLWMALVYLVALLLVLSGLIGIAGLLGQPIGVRLLALVVLIVLAGITLIFGHLVREMTIMLADIADGVLYVAEQQDRVAAQPNQDW